MSCLLDWPSACGRAEHSSGVSQFLQILTECMFYRNCTITGSPLALFGENAALSREDMEDLARDRIGELEEKNAVLERLNKLFVGREFRIKEHKEKIAILKKNDIYALHINKGKQRLIVTNLIKDKENKMEKSNKVSEAKVAISRKKIGGEIPIVVNELTDRCLYTGFFGTLDSARMKAITDKVLEMLGATGIEMVVIDLANIDIIDSAVASHLVRLGETLTLIGVESIFCGIMPPVAQIMITAGIEMKGFKISRDLKAAIKLVFELQGIKLVKIEPGLV